MRDLNFFEPFVESQRGAEKKQKILVTSLIVIIVLVAAFPVFNFVRIYRMENQIASINSILETPEAIEQIQRVRDKENLAATLRNQLQLLANIDKGIKNVDIITEVLIQEIIGTMPERLYFRSVSINPNNIAIQGTASDKISIAEFEYNLRLTGAFDEIFIPSITLDRDIYNFTIQFRVKEVN